MLFGEFLLRQRAIDEEALVGALDMQQRSKLFVGKLAVDEGLMTVEQVLAVLNAQVDDRRSFGLLAVEMGLIDEDGLDRAIALQRSAIPPLGEILVAQGALERARMRELLDSYFETARNE